MNDDPSVREWLARYGDWLLSAEFIALLSASVAGFVQRVKGMAMFVSHVASGVATVVLFVIGTAYFQHSDILVAVSAGTLGGAAGMALFRMLVKIADRLETRSSDIADKIIAKGSAFLPGGKE
jgi:hypothetical protein